TSDRHAGGDRPGYRHSTGEPPRIAAGCPARSNDRLSTRGKRQSAVKDARGFTLLEMIVATVIMAVAIVGLLSGISGAVRNASRLTAYDRAVQLARWRMNELLIDDKTPRNVEIDGSFDRQQNSGVDTGWRAR